MIAVSLVLILLLTSTSFILYHNINNQIDNILTLISENNGTFPKLPHQPQPTADSTNFLTTLSPEKPYETRFFTVIFDTDYNVISTNTKYIAAISSSEAINMAMDALNTNKESDFNGNYKFKITTTDQDDLMIIFVDCTRDFNALYSFISTSIRVSCIGLLSFFFVIYALSNRALKPIIESYAKQKKFITNASHELKTPLTIIDANTEVIELLNGESEWTQSIRNQVNRLSLLTNSLVSLARMDEDSIKLKHTSFSFSDLLLQEVDSFSHLAMSKKKQLNTSIQHDVLYYGDKVLISQLISILLDNAIKYSDNNAMIEVSLQKFEKKIELSFYNTVTEIKTGNHQALFERFYRADSSRNSANLGFGIGLSLAQSIVELHHGKITATSSNTLSICFTITLPIKKSKS